MDYNVFLFFMINDNYKFDVTKIIPHSLCWQITCLCFFHTLSTVALFLLTVLGWLSHLLWYEVYLTKEVLQTTRNVHMILTLPFQ
jgi:hypothetical protein